MRWFKLLLPAAGLSAIAVLFAVAPQDALAFSPAFAMATPA